MDCTVIDLTRVKNVFSVFYELSNKMQWEQWYAFNLDALHDILTAEKLDSSEFIIKRRSSYSDIAWGHGEAFTKYVNRLCHVFMDAAEENSQILVRIEIE